MQPNRQFPPQRLPPGSSADAPSEAPADTIVVVGPEGGYAMPSGQHKLLFGRGRGNVHVAVGVDDRNVSRRHGEFTCMEPRRRLVLQQHREAAADRNAGRHPAAARPRTDL
jgi:hypothetical protein